MKKFLKVVFKTLSFLLILCLFFLCIINITKRKYSYQKMEDFFNQKENFDVLFLGSSRSVYGVYPMELWRDYGLISYNLGQYTCHPVGSYWNMLLALQHTKPKLIVVDTGLISNNVKISKDYSHLHNMLDSYPLSYTKYCAVKDLFDGKDLLNKEVEYLLNFSLYHSRWDELSANDFSTSKNQIKGAEYAIKVEKTNAMSNFESVDIYKKQENINMQYLRKIIEYCQNNDINILVTYLPHPASDNDIAASKYVKNICDEYDVNYINFLEINVIDYKIDCSDKSSHLNPSGARKVTDYIGKYIIKNYDGLNQKNNEKYSFWNEDYNNYIDLKIKYLNQNVQILENYLMLLYDEKDIRYEIKISNKKKIEENSVLKILLNNLENKYDIDDSVFNEKEDKSIKITTYDKRNEQKIKEVWF